MAYIKLPSTLSWSNIYTLSGITQGKSLILTNCWTRAITVVESTSQPATNARGYPVMPSSTVSLSYKGLPFWIRGEDGYIAVDELSNQAIEPMMGVDLPTDVWTSGILEVRRLKVDVGQTSFFSGVEFRTFKEFSITAGSTYTMKATLGTNIVLHQAETTIDSGLVRLTILVGGTEGAAFSEMWPVISKNSMTGTPAYTSQVSITAGGTHTGGTTLDIVRIAAESLGGRAASVVTSQDDVRGVPPQVYYYRFQNIGNSTVNGTFHGWWEER